MTIYNAYHYQHNLINHNVSIWSFWYCASLFFSTGSFYKSQKNLTLNHGLSYIDNLHLLEPLPLSESKNHNRYIYFISNHHSTTYKPQELTPVHRNTIKTKLSQNITKMFVVEFPLRFTLFSYAAPLQLLLLHPSSAVPV